MKHPLHRFMLGVLVFFPLTFFIWYITAPWHLAPITWLTNQLLDVVFPQAVMWLGLEQYTLVVASNFGHNASGLIVSPPTGEDLLGFHLNPLIYCYSLPLLCALTLATPGQDKGINLVWGMFLIVPTEVFSMFFSVAKTLTFDVGAAFQQQQNISPLGADMIALAYQAGTLIIPMVAPLIIWIALHRSFLVVLAPRLEQAFGR